MPRETITLSVNVIFELFFTFQRTSPKFNDNKGLRLHPKTKRREKESRINSNTVHPIHPTRFLSLSLSLSSKRSAHIRYLVAVHCMFRLMSSFLWLVWRIKHIQNKNTERKKVNKSIRIRGEEEGEKKKSHSTDANGNLGIPHSFFLFSLLPR